jgi:hypothetical protein
VILDLHVQPGASRSEFAGRHGERIKVRLAARAVDGKANEALIELSSASHSRSGKAQACASFRGLSRGRRRWRSMADEKSLKTLTTAVYALQAAGFLIGSLDRGVVIDYVKRDEAKGTGSSRTSAGRSALLVGPAVGAIGYHFLIYRG